MADQTILLRDIKLYLLTVLRTANPDVLPLDWTVAAAEFIETIDAYQARAGKHFDLSPAKAEATALAQALAGFHERLSAGTINADQANAVMLALARILVPLNFTRRPRFLHDPALSIPRLPAIASAADLRRPSAN